jgi:ribosomal protein S18 acetylase RimI-like enzyme
MSVAVTPARVPDDLDHVRALFREYGEWLGEDLCLHGFGAELENLPGPYAPPGGRLLLARLGGEPAGCVALRALEGDACELKRLYVRPAFRGRGVGRALVASALEAARAAGYRRVCLDTLPRRMAEAQALYRAFGFTPIEPYYANPIPGAVYLALTLATS